MRYTSLGWYLTAQLCSYQKLPPRFKKCGTTVSTTLCRLLCSYGTTHKKVQHVARQRRLDLNRASFIASTLKEMFVWVDETVSNIKDMLRKYGYAFSSERAICHRLLVQGQHISSISSLCTEGILAVELITDSVNKEKFFLLHHGSLIPEMLPFNGYNCKSIAVMDNCSIHHVEAVVELFNCACWYSIFTIQSQLQPHKTSIQLRETLP